ncbi:MAG: hypothetical protein HYR66_13445 [Sphingobacteriales bacterium]|nr:hypothetical protein [Sphingobacteriales bacterium]MBI3719039.1 hypothetical protein [Sphingobacteriales bacterium]
MLNKEDFIHKFNDYPDKKILEIFQSTEDYSNEAREAVNMIIKQRGGITVITDNIKNEEKIKEEVSRIREEAGKLFAKDKTKDVVKRQIASDIIAQKQVNEIINEQHKEYEEFLRDTSIDSKTIALAITGMVIATCVGGAGWGLQLIFSHKTFYLLLIGLVLLCFGIVSSITKKTMKNKIVLLTSLLAVVFSILLGYLLFWQIGYQG